MSAKTMLPFLTKLMLMSCMAAISAGLLSGCAAPKDFIRKVDERRVTISRGLADFVDGADRAFGEPRIEDREKIVQFKLGLKPEYWKEDEFGLNIPVSFRIPIPALQRRANMFLQLETSADDAEDFTEAKTELEENRSVTAGILSSVTDNIDMGTKLNMYWSSGLQTSVTPFIRFEIKPDPFRYYVEQQAYYRTDDRFGGRTTFQLDRIINQKSYIRFHNSGEYSEVINGVNLTHSAIYRRIAWWNALLSTEIGLNFNPHKGSSEGDSSSYENDGDKFFSRVRFAGKLPLAWLEYEIEPGVDYYWHHQEKLDYGISFMLRIIFESYLRGDHRSGD